MLQNVSGDGGTPPSVCSAGIQSSVVPAGVSAEAGPTFFTCLHPPLEKSSFSLLPGKMVETED